MQTKIINMKLNIATLKKGKIVLNFDKKEGKFYKYITDKKIEKNVLKKYNPNILLELMYQSFINTSEDDYKFLVEENKIIPTERTLENINYFAEDFLEKIK